MQGIGQSAGKSFAYLLGVYLGDGCVTTMSAKGGRYTYTVFRLNSIDPDFIEATRAALADLGVERIWVSCHPVKKSSKPNHSLTAKAENLCDEMVFATYAKTKLPPMKGWTRAEKLAFVAGLMDSEGFVAANSNTTNRRFYMGFKCCDPWVPEFRDLLESLGIRTGKFSTEAPLRDGYKAPQRFAIKMQSWIDSGAKFRIARKQNRVDEWGAAGAYERRARFPRQAKANLRDFTPNAGASR